MMLRKGPEPVTNLDDLLPEEFNTPDARAARDAATEDQNLLVALITARQDAGMTREDLASRAGLPVSEVADFERLGHDPRLSTVRRYARAVGITVRHAVEPMKSGQSVG